MAIFARLSTELFFLSKSEKGCGDLWFDRYSAGILAGDGDYFFKAILETLLSSEFRFWSDTMLLVMPFGLSGEFSCPFVDIVPSMKLVIS